MRSPNRLPLLFPDPDVTSAPFPAIDALLVVVIVEGGVEDDVSLLIEKLLLMCPRGEAGLDKDDDDPAIDEGTIDGNGGNGGPTPVMGGK